MCAWVCMCGKGDVFAREGDIGDGGGAELMWREIRRASCRERV